MEKQYLVTERAHFMCPNMHFGMLLEVDKQYQKEKVQETLDRMAEAHPFLKCLIAYEDGTNQLFYNVMPASQVDLVLRSDESTLWTDYKIISKQDWNVFENGLLKVYIYPKIQGMAVLFIAHHLLVDGRGLLELAQEFTNDYVEDTKPVYVEEQVMESLDDLPPNSSLAGIGKWLINRANAQWKKENHIVDYDQYKRFVEKYSEKHPIEYETYEVDKATVMQMSQQCKDNGLTMNDLLMAHMYLKTKTNKIIIAVDIRNRLSKYKKGALGNYATAMGIQCKHKTTDVVELAKDVHGLVQKHMAKNRLLMLVLACYFEMNPTLLDAAAISALDGFESKAGKFVGDRMFGLSTPKAYSITNLGKVENRNIKSIMFIPPASPAAKLTLGVITLNGTMKACTSSAAQCFDRDKIENENKLIVW